MVYCARKPHGLLESESRFARIVLASSKQLVCSASERSSKSSAWSSWTTVSVMVRFGKCDAAWTLEYWPSLLQQQCWCNWPMIQTSFCASTTASNFTGGLHITATPASVIAIYEAVCWTGGHWSCLKWPSLCQNPPLIADFHHLSCSSLVLSDSYGLTSFPGEGFAASSEDSSSSSAGASCSERGHKRPYFAVAVVSERDGDVSWRKAYCWVVLTRVSLSSCKLLIALVYCSFSLI